MLTLHHYWSSVCAQKVRIVLAAKGLDWESVHVDLFRFEQWAPDFVALNPKAVVPVLRHEGTVVTESNVICEYLEEVFPDVPLMPAGPAARAAVRRWMVHVEEDMHSPIAAASFNGRHRARMLARYTLDEIRAHLDRAPSTELARTALARIEHGLPAEAEDAAYRALDRVLDWAEAGLAGRDWLVDGRPTLADIAFAPYLNRIEVLDRPEQLSPAVRPRVAAWWARLQALPAYRAAMAFRNPDAADPVAR